MSIAVLIALVLTSFIVSLAMTGALRKVGHRLARLDRPNERSLHDEPRPRTGGLAILAASGIGGATVALLSGANADWAWIATGSGMIAAVSFLDDRIQLSPVPRFLVHLFASSIVVAGGVRFGASTLQVLLPDVAVAIAIVLGLTWTTNLFNFMDGLDGFAGGMAVVGFAAFAWIAWRAGAATLAGMTGVLAAAAGGFLIFNRPTAQIFMGDAGASTLGFLTGSIAVLGVRDGVWPWQVAGLIFSPFFVDATVTLARRIAQREKVWLPHRSHYYQRLVRAGWSHCRTVLWEYVLMLGCAATAIVGMERGWGSWRPVLMSWAAVYAACMWLVNVIEGHQRESPGRAERT